MFHRHNLSFTVITKVSHISILCSNIGYETYDHISRPPKLSLLGYESAAERLWVLAPTTSLPPAGLPAGQTAGTLQGTGTRWPATILYCSKCLLSQQISLHSCACERLAL